MTDSASPSSEPSRHSYDDSSEDVQNQPRRRYGKQIVDTSSSSPSDTVDKGHEVDRPSRFPVTGVSATPVIEQWISRPRP